jgi:hypothetical protein
MTTTRIARITGSATPDYIKDTCDDGMAPNPIPDHMTREQYTAHALSYLKGLDWNLNRWIKWFRSCTEYSTKVKAAGIYEQNLTWREERDVLIAAGLGEGPKGRRPGEKSGAACYSDARVVRQMLHDLGAQNVPGRPLTMDGLDDVSAFAHAFFATTRKTVR